MSSLRVYDNTILVCGVDEAGRGCLAGPVYAAAVILDNRNIPPGLNDSKKLNAKHRGNLRPMIEQSAIRWAVASADAETIDEINILQASILAMHRAVEKLGIRPELLLIDGNRFKAFNDIPHKLIVGGDGIYVSIAAASILAKTHRDEYMQELHAMHPEYGWARNKAYATPDHIAALLKIGPSPFHRKSFSLKNQTKLPF